MNAAVRTLCAQAEQAARAGDFAASRAAFFEAAACATEDQLWRPAIRCYRRALELDLLDHEAVERVMQMPARVLSGSDWSEYAGMLERRPAWPHFGCRGVQLVIGDLGAVLACPPVGSVLELFMTGADLVETRPDARFAAMPSVMSLIIVRRALWLDPREHTTAPRSIRVSFNGRQRIRLFELGEWEPIVG